MKYPASTGWVRSLSIICKSCAVAVLFAVQCSAGKDWLRSVSVAKCHLCNREASDDVQMEFICAFSEEINSHS